MGLAIFTTRPEPARPVTGRIGALPRRQISTATTLVPSAGGWLFGEEVPMACRVAVRTIGRASLPAIVFFRLEYEIERRIALELGLGPAARLVASELPLAQRSVQLCGFQRASARLVPVVFEDLEGLPSPFDAAEVRRAAGRGEAIAAVQALAANPYSSDAKVMVASLVEGQFAGFVGYEDGGVDRANQRADASTAFSVVADPERVRADLFADPLLIRVFEQTGDGRLPTPHLNGVGAIPLPAEVSDKAPIHLDLAIRQSMAGAGARHAKWAGRPVALYARDLFLAHMLNALDRRDDIPPTINLAHFSGFDDADEG